MEFDKNALQELVQVRYEEHKSTIDHLRSLRGHGDQRGEPPTEIFKQRVRQLPEREGLYEQLWQLSVEEREAVFEIYLLLPFLTSLPETHANRLRSVCLGLLETRDPNAWTLKTSTGDDLIVFHSDLSAIASFYAEFIVISQVYREAWETSEFREMVENTADWVGHVFSESQRGPYPAFPYDLARENMKTVAAATFAMEYFVLAHECAHIVLRHTSNTRTRSVHFSDSTETGRRYEWRHQQEYDADLQALEWLCQIPQTNMDSGLPSEYNLSFAAMNRHAALEVFELMNFAEIGGRSSARPTHPPATNRLRRLLDEGARMLTAEELSVGERMIVNMKVLKGENPL